MKRVAFKTVGCRLNQAETAQMAAGFEAAGYAVVPFGEPCDVCVIHTCSITGRAEQKCLMFARAARRSPIPPLVVLTGCAVDLAGEALKKRCGADLAVGRDAKFDIPRLLEGSRQETGVRNQFEGRMADSGIRHPAPCPLPPVSSLPPPALLPRFDTTRALVKVQDGCDFRCAYCVVPLARGAARSRPFDDILNEVRLLADAGYCEVVLTGANLGCYQDGSRRLANLIEAVERQTSIQRIRLSSIEVSTTELAVLEYMASSPKLCRYLHIPLQSGDDRILRSMGRRYTSREYRDLAACAVRKIPGIGLGTDVLVGLPGEDDRAFANTLAVLEELPFSNLHIFPYSRRPATRAADMPGQVSASIKKERCLCLKELGRRKRHEFAAQFVGKPVEVLIEAITAQGIGSGWSGERIEAHLHRPQLKTNQLVTFRPARVEGAVLHE